MKILIHLIAAIPVIALVGCSPMRYSQYTGQKRNWRTATAAMAETQYRIPVYRGWPDRPYFVLGSIRFVDRNKYWDDGVIKMACDMAKSKGGDAIIIRYGGEFGVGMITGGAADPQVVSIANDTTALVIKWLSPSEVQAAKAVAAGLLDQFQKQHPEIASKPELTDIATEYVRSLGLALDSDEAIRTFNQVLNSVLIPPRDGQSDWLYRGIIRIGSLTTSQSDTMYGLAKIVRTGDNVTIVSKSKASDLTFSGTVQNSALSGQLGITVGGTIVSTKAEGVLTDEKISLTGQGQTPDGTILTSVSFSH